MIHWSWYWEKCWSRKMNNQKITAQEAVSVRSLYKDEIQYSPFLRVIDAEIICHASPVQKHLSLGDGSF